MASILQDLLGKLQGGDLAQLSKAIGADENQTKTAASAALPVLMEALSRNSRKPDGAQALEKALDRDHDGSILDNLSGFFGKQDTSAGAGILKHMLGGSRQNNVEQGLSKATGLGSSAIGKLLPMLAPLVMGAIGKSKKQGNIDLGGLAGMLQSESKEIERQDPKASGLLGKLFDQDGDGDVDLADLAKGALGKLFG